ncbi:MAG: GNAT family N-acetyltransferase [Defluviitaleaceae bacterium]|nr:GNAT family N-acetyltransferase [Defluviitaleaceae bacterium]
MELVFPEIGHKQAAMDYRREHVERGEAWIHGSGGLLRYEDYESWLEKITTAQTAAQTGWVNCSTYFALVDGKIVGMTQIRHTLNDALLKSGGHIGYGIRPSERRKGYAAQMLALALEKCRELGIQKVLVTCDKDNVGSARTAMKNGGVLEDECAEGSGNIVQRYWITI